MREKVKTFVLIVLVFASLGQSYILAYSTPHFEAINESEYIETQKMGTQEKLENLINPNEIVLHFGEDRHTVLYPDMTFFNLIYNTLKDERAFEGLHVTNNWSKDWEQYRKNYKGVEIRYHSGISLSLLHGILQIKGDTLYESDKINRIWLLVNDNQEVHIYFFSDNSPVVYEASNANITEKDIETFVGFGTYWAESGHGYQSKTGDYYIPLQDISMKRLRYSYTSITPEQMENSLFSDPAITRNIQEKDGTEIYTDGKRGMQINNEQKWMVFSDSIAPVDSGHNTEDDMYAAVQFINQHGGWNSKYQLYAVNRGLQDGGQTIIFRQYVRPFPESYPVINTGDINFGYIKLVMQKGAVSDYERSLITLDPKSVEERNGVLQGGEALQKRIGRYANKSRIASVFPAYRAEISGNYVDLIPVWAVELHDGELDVLK